MRHVIAATDATRSSWSPAAIVRGLIALSGGDTPFRRMALARLDLRSSAYGGSMHGVFHGKKHHDSGCLEAVARPRRRISDAESAERRNRVSRAGACGVQSHANTMSPSRIPGISAMGFTRASARTEKRARARGRAPQDLCGANVRPRKSSPQSMRTRLRRWPQRRIDQRGLASPPLRRCGSTEHRRLRSHQREGAALGRSQAQRPVRRDRHAQGGGRAADCQASQGSGNTQVLGADGHGPVDWRGSRRRGRAARSGGRAQVIEPDQPNGGLALLRGICAGRGVVKMPEKGYFRGTGGCSTTRRRFGPSTRPESEGFPGDSRGLPKAGRVCANLAVTGALQGQGWVNQVRS